MKIGVNISNTKKLLRESSQKIKKKHHFNNKNLSCWKIFNAYLTILGLYATDNKSFWKPVKPHFSNKGSSSNKIAQVENDAVIINDKVISKTMNKFLRLRETHNGLQLPVFLFFFLFLFFCQPCPEYRSQPYLGFYLSI